MPPNATIALNTFRVIALGEFIPYNEVTDPIKEELGAVKEEEDVSNPVWNMGVMLGILVVLVVVASLVALFSSIC